MSGNEEFVRQVREAGESLIKNSNDIVGDAKYLNGIVHRGARSRV